MVPAGVTLSEGAMAPDFSLINEEGQRIQLKDFRGKWVVLYFYPKDNTPGCTLEAVDFSSARGDFDRLNAVVMGVSRDSAMSHKRFIEKKSLAVTLLSDPDHVMMEDYGVWQLKKMYGRESMGIVRSTYLIDPEGVIAGIWPKVKVKGHVDEVKQRLLDMTA